MTDKIETTDEMKAFHKAIMELFMESPVDPIVKIGTMGNILGRALVTSGIEDIKAAADVLANNVRQGMSESITFMARAEMEADELNGEKTRA